MFEQLQKFLQNFGAEEESSEFSRDDPRVAAAALFFHVIDADGVVEPVELEKVKELLERRYGLDGAELQKLIDAGQQAEDESIDFYAFTSVLKRHLDSEQRVQFIELLWELVYADGVRQELEDNVVWRVAELMGVSDRDRVLMRQRVADRLGARDDD